MEERMKSVWAALSHTPTVYERSPDRLWTDEYISRRLLEAHLDPHSDGASRNAAFIEKSAARICTFAPPETFPRLLDLGCGPGLYAERFAAAGYRVTGVDFSPVSVGYARQSAERKKLGITYLCADYLTAGLPDNTDFAVMIYCDYGALPAADRAALLGRLYRCLRPGGRLLLDVFSRRRYDAFRAGRAWTPQESGGFWSGGPHVVLSARRKYPPDVTLESTVVLTDAETAEYYIWTTYFTRESLLAETAAAGFVPVAVYGDVAGAPCTADSDTLAVLLERP